MKISHLQKMSYILFRRNCLAPKLNDKWDTIHIYRLIFLLKYAWTASAPYLRYVRAVIYIWIIKLNAILTLWMLPRIFYFNPLFRILEGRWREGGVLVFFEGSFLERINFSWQWGNKLAMKIERIKREDKKSKV